MHTSALLSRRYFRRHSVHTSERWYCHITRVLRLMLHKRIRAVAYSQKVYRVKHKFYDRVAESEKLLGPWWTSLILKRETKLWYFDLFFDIKYLSSILLIIRYRYLSFFMIFNFNENFDVFDYLTIINSLYCNVKIFKICRN